MSYEELDSVVDVVRERARNEREALAEFAQPELTNLCERCLEPSLASLCRNCDPWNEGLHQEGLWTYDEDVRYG